MPSSVQHLLASAGLTWHSVSPWGTRPRLERPGVYLLSTSEDRDAVDGLATSRLSQERLRELAAARPEIAVAGRPGTVERLVAALEAMWPSGETVVYIGLAGTSVAHRVGQYYSTPLGARAPHAGGWPIKTLADLDRLHVHVAAAEDPARAEEMLLRTFMSGVFPASRDALSDPSLPLPFANLQLTSGMRKRHGIEGAKPSRLPSSTRGWASPPSVAAAPFGRSVGGLYVLNVTAADVAAGRIRVTTGPKHALGLPGVRADLPITVRGEALTVTWDPRIGADKERSGVLQVGRGNLARLLGGPASLTVGRDPGGRLDLD